MMSIDTKYIIKKLYDMKYKKKVQLLFQSRWSVVKISSVKNCTVLRVEELFQNSKFTVQQFMNQSVHSGSWTYLCVHSSLWTYAYIQVYEPMRIFMFVKLCVHSNLWTYAYIQVYEPLRTFKFMNLCVHSSFWTNAYIQVYEPTHTFRFTGNLLGTINCSHTTISK